MGEKQGWRELKRTVARDVEKQKSAALGSRVEPDMRKKPFLLSGHLGSHLVLVACETQLSFLLRSRGARVVRWSFALLLGRIRLCWLLFLGKAHAFERTVYPAQESASCVLNKQ